MSTVESALDALRRGEPVVVLDDAERENEADLVLAAEHATAEPASRARRAGSRPAIGPKPRSEPAWPAPLVALG